MKLKRKNLLCGVLVTALCFSVFSGFQVSTVKADTNQSSSEAESSLPTADESGLTEVPEGYTAIRMISDLKNIDNNSSGN